MTSNIGHLLALQKGRTCAVATAGVWNGPSLNNLVLEWASPCYRWRVTQRNALLFRAMLRFNHLANIRVRGLSRGRIHVYLALCAQVLKRIGEMIMERLIKPHARCPATA